MTTVVVTMIITDVVTLSTESEKISPGDGLATGCLCSEFTDILRRYSQCRFASANLPVPIRSESADPIHARRHLPVVRPGSRGSKRRGQTVAAGLRRAAEAGGGPAGSGVARADVAGNRAGT